MPIPEIERQVVREIDRVAFVVHEYENILSFSLSDIITWGHTFHSFSHTPYILNCIGLTVDHHNHHQQSINQEGGRKKRRRSTYTVSQTWPHHMDDHNLGCFATWNLGLHTLRVLVLSNYSLTDFTSHPVNFVVVWNTMLT